MPRYIENLNECTDPVSGDFMWLVDASAGSTDKDRKVDVGKFARLAVVTAFTKPVTVSPTVTTEKSLVLNGPTSTSVPVQEWRYAGSERAKIELYSNLSQFTVSTFDNGSGAGCRIFADRNSNASTPAAGTLGLRDKGNQSYWLWPDDSGVFRIDTALPINANDTAGTVVGAQTSHVAYKDVIGAPVDDEEALVFVLDAADQVQRFTYKSGAYNGEEFSGVILDGDTLHRYGQDADAEHPAGKSLNTINAIGDLFLAVRALTNRIGALEDKAHE